MTMKFARHRTWSFPALAIVAVGLFIDRPAPAAAADPPAKRSKLDVDDEDEPPVKPKPAAPPKQPPADSTDSLAPQPAAEKSAAGTADELSVPVCDTILCRKAGRRDPLSFRVRLLPQMLTLPLAASQEYQFPLATSRDSGKSLLKLRGQDVISVSYYEERVRERAADELGVSPKELTDLGRVFDLSDASLARKSRRVVALLQRAVAEHDSAVQRSLRTGAMANASLRRPLVVALFKLRLSAIDQMIRQGSPAAESLCDRALEEFRELPTAQTELQLRYERILLPRAEAALANQEYSKARHWLSQLENRFAGNLETAGVALRERLIALARAKAKEAEQVKQTDPRKSAELIELAAQIWPALPGLSDQQSRLASEYQILDCAYAQLPDDFSALCGTADAERHAAALLFESLVRWREDQTLGAHYAPRLAVDGPLPLVRGREFRLAQTNWSDSDDRRLTAEDVIWTVKLLSSRDVPGYSRSWAKLVDAVVQDGDPFTAAITLKRDYWQPLSLMQFKILPKHRFPLRNIKEELANFDARPVGTGPYVQVKRDANLVRFVANPRYRHAGLPHIREITFNALDPTKSLDLFLQDKIQLIYALRREGIKQLDQQGKGRLVHSLATPGVYFLAPNYRQRALANQDLRLAIAHGIDRPAILNQYFHSGRPDEANEALTGPYPRKSWAYSPKPMAYNRALAKGYADRAKTALNKIPKLRLAYPGGDPDTESACKEMQTQLAQIGIPLELNAVAPRDLHRQIVVNQTFDLVYWRHRYEDETYWFWPLVDPDCSQPGGSNFMGCQPDVPVAELFQQILFHKNFATIRDLTHKVHEDVFRTATVIPLWQLDVYVAVSDSVTVGRLDPLDLFGDVQQWRRRVAKP